MITFSKNTGMSIKEPGKLAKEENNVDPGSDGTKIMAMNKLRLGNGKYF